MSEKKDLQLQQQHQQATTKKSKPLFPMPPGPGEVDQRPLWLKFLDNPLGETVRACNKVENKVAKKFSKKKRNKNSSDDATVASSSASVNHKEEESSNTEPLLPAAAF